MYSVTKKAATIGAAVAFSVVGAATYAVVTSGANSSQQSSVVNGKFSDSTTTASPTDTTTAAPTGTATATATDTTAPAATTAPVPSDTTSVAPSQPAPAPSSAAPQPSAPASSAAPVVKAPVPPSGPCYQNHTVTISADGSAKSVDISWKVGPQSGSSSGLPWSHVASAFGCGEQAWVQIVVNNPSPGMAAPRCSIAVDGSVVATCGAAQGNGVSALVTIR